MVACLLVSDLAPSPPLAGRIWALLGILGLGGLALLLFGVAGFLLLGGIATLALGLQSRRSMTGPVCWAAAVILEYFLLGSQMVGLRFVFGGAIPWLLADLLLAVPLLAGVALFVVRRPMHDQSPVPSARPWLLAVVASPALLGIALFDLRDRFLLLAPNMGGDAARHFGMARWIGLHGGVQLSDFKRYPVFMDGVEALFVRSGPSRGATPAGHLLFGITAQSHFFLTSTLSVTILLGAAVLLLLPRRLVLSPRLNVGTSLVVVAAGSIGYSAFALYPGFHGGFTSTMPATAVTLANLMVGLQFFRSPSPLLFLLLGAASCILLVSWTPLVIVPVALIVGLSILSQWGPPSMALRRRTDRLCIAASLVAVLVCVGAVASSWSTLHRNLILIGAFVPMRKGGLLLLGLLCLLLVVVEYVRGRRSSDHSLLFMLLAVGVVIGLSLLLIAFFRSLPNASNVATSGWPTFWMSGGWPYYAVKFMWALTMATSWLAFLPFIFGIDAVARLQGGKLLGVALGGLALFGALFVPPIGVYHHSALQEIRAGWQAPSVDSLHLLLDNANRTSPTLFWNATTRPGDSRLLNYWEVALWDNFPLPNGSYRPVVDFGANKPAEMLRSWSQTEQDTPESICDLLRQLPPSMTVTVLTRHVNGANELALACPQFSGRAVVEVLP